MNSSKKIVLVGHCGPDMHLLKAAVGRVAPDISVASVNDDTSLQEYTTADSVLLINRELDGSFFTTSGLALIEDLAQLATPPIMMLISNYQEAQSEAQNVGAREGFGKSQLYDDRTENLILDALE